MQLSRRVQQIPASITLELAAKVTELRAQGVDVVGLGAGEPDFATPPEAIDAATDFLSERHVGYTAAAGIAPLREAAAEQISAITGVTYAPAQIVVTSGAKEALSLTLMALAEPGDEVIVPSPAWLSYGPMVTISGATIVDVLTSPEHGFKLTPEALRAAIGPKTRALLLNTPSNPTGAVYSRAELAALAEVLQGTDVAVISDEIYSHFVFDGEHVSPAGLPGMAERTAVVHGVSKAYAMTGWRIGWVAAPPDLAGAVGRLKSQFSANASAPSQHAALGALRSAEGYPARLRTAFARRRDLVVAAVEAIDGLSVTRPAGTFYAFVRADACYGGAVTSSTQFCSALLEAEAVVATPGAAFGEDRYVRLSFATGEERLTEGMERLSRFVEELRASHAPRAGGLTAET